MEITASSSSFSFEISSRDALLRLPWLGEVFAHLEDTSYWDRWRERGSLFLRLGRLEVIMTPQSTLRALERARQQDAWRRRASR